MVELSSLVLFANDLDATVAFYQALGVPLAEENHDDGVAHQAAELAGIHFAVYPAQTGQGTIAPDWRSGSSDFPGFYVDSLDKASAALSMLRSDLLQPHQVMPWGCRVVVRDPDGRPIEVNQRNHCSSALVPAEVRLAFPGEVDAAIATWHSANPGSDNRGHAIRLQQWAQDDDSDLFVAMWTDQVVGTALLLPGRELDGAGELVPGLSHLTGVAVLPEHRRQLVGTELVDAVLERARARGSTRVTLWARSDNVPGHALFTSRGFTPTGRSDHDAAGTPMTHLQAIV